MEVTTVYITNIPVIYNGDIEIQIAEVTAEKTLQKEEFSDGESFKIECDMPEEIEQNDPEKCDESELEWIEGLKEISGETKKRKPFSCCHCEFIGNNATEVRRHKRDMDSQIFHKISWPIGSIGWGHTYRVFRPTEFNS